MNEQIKPWERKWAGVIDDKKEQDNGGVISGSLNTVRDLGVSALKGAVEVPNAVIGLGDAVSAALGVGDGGNLRRALANDDGVIGFNPAQAKRMMNEWHSDDYKQAQQDFANAEGIAAKTKVALSNPLDIIANTITESAPSMLAGGLAGGAARGALVKAGMSGGKAALAGGAIGEGLMGAGSAAAGIQEETGGTLSQGQGLAALGSGVATGLLGLAGGRMAQKLGVADVDSALTHATSGQSLGKVAGEITQNVAPQSVPLAVIKGAIAEGLLEELPQSVSEQLIQNLATGKDWHDDLDGAAVLGVLSGMAMGGSMAGVSAVAENQDIAQNQALAQAQEEIKNQQWQQRLQEMEQFHAQDLAQKQAIENEKKLNQEMALNQHLENLQQEKDLMQKVQDIEQGAGFVQSDVPQAIKPSEQMGLDPNAGTLSAAAVQAVDSGAAVLPENVAQSADLPMSQAAGVAAGNGENVAHQAENAVSGSLNNEPVQVEPLMSYRVADEVQENALPPFEIVANREPDYRVSAAMRKNPDKLGNLLNNDKRADGGLSPRKRLAAMPKTLQNAFEVLADYHADFALRRENGLPDVREQYPQKFQAARTLVKQHLQDNPQDRDLFDNLNAAALVYRRNVGWTKPLERKVADVNGVEPKKEQGVNPAPETVEPTVQPVSEPVGAQQAEQVNDMNKAASKSPEQSPPDLIDVQTADGKTKRVSRADWENGDLASLPTYSANGKKTAVKLKRDNVKQNNVSSLPDTPPVNMTDVAATQQNNVSGSLKTENTPKIIGKNQDGKDIFEKADGVRYIQNGKFIKQDSVRISPNGNYVATENRDDELKTVEELAQQSDNDVKPQQTEQNNELERIAEPERADERAAGSRTQHQVEPVSELAADNAGTLDGMATENGAGNESAGGVEVSNRPSGRADDDGVGREHGNGHAPTRGAERSGATTSAVATRELSEQKQETANSGSLKTAEHTQEQDFSDKKQLIQAAQQLGKLEIVGLGDKVATEPQQDDGKANSRDVAADKVVSDEIKQRLDLVKSHKVNWDGDFEKQNLMALRGLINAFHNNGLMSWEDFVHFREMKPKSPDFQERLNELKAWIFGHDDMTAAKQSQTAEQQENAPELLDMLPELTHLGWKYEPHYQTGAPEFTLSFLKVFNAKMQQVKNVAFGEHSFREFIQNHDIQGKNNREIAQSIHDEMMNKYAIDGYEFQAVDVQPAAGVLAQEIAPEFPIEASEQTKTQELNAQEKVPVSTNASEQADFAISDDDRIGEGGAKTKFKQNLAAIETLKTLLNENRDATASEQKILAKWVGWGGLANAFRRADGSFNKGWENETQQLESVLTADELAAARESTTTAFYTPPEVIKAMWQAVERMGFKGGRVLEPSVGSGSFIGLMPKGLRQSTAMHGTELDTITGNLAKKLYPKAKIQVMGFEQYAIPDGHFRLAIGNPPFGGWKITDKAKSHLNGLAIHNYFFAKSVDALEDNGVLAMVVTNNFMDASDRNDKARDYIAKNTELLAAVRLPNNAFEKNAGTSVTTDVIFLRKLTADERAAGQTVGHDWNGTTMHTDKDGNQVPLNVYFANNPDMMLGEFGAFGGMYGGNTAALVAPKGQNTAKLLNEKLQNLPQNIFRQPEKNETALQQGMVQSIPDVKVGSLFIQDGKVFKRLPDELGEKRSEPFTDMPDNATAIKRIEGMIGIRDVLADVRQLQLTPNVAEGVLSARRKQLNQVYDDFVKKYGYLNSQTNKNLFDDDPSMPQLLALEENYDKGISRDVAKKTGQTAREPAAQKAAIFSKRTQYPTLEVERVGSAKDGLIESLNSVGRVDIHRIAAKYGKEPSEVIAELGDLVFEDPVHGWHTAEQYLSGNVKAKLAQAKEAAKHFPALMRNVQALEAVQPEDIEAADIVVRLGASWLPESVVSQFLRQVAGLTHWSGKGLAVGYAKPIAEWSLAQDPVFTADAKARFGTARTSIKDIVQAALNGKTVNVYDKQTINGQEKAILNQEATDEANAKIDELKRAFDDWIWQDDTRRDELARLYNDLFNTDVQTQYDGSHLKLAGKVDDDVIALRPTQKNAVWRITQNQNTLLDHVVGAGKTFTMVAAAMELRRMGLANKPMIVVPNHLVGQWGKEFAQLYPNANILVAGKKDFEKGRRKRLVARVANGDWDAVIVGHSSFEKVPVDKAFQVEFMQRQIVEISAAIEIMREKEGKRSSSAKDMERRRKSIEAKLERLLESKEKDDDNLNWNELGVDALFVDEAHEFKNLGFVSSMRNVAGLGNPEGSQKAMDLYLKVQQMQQNPDSRVVFATGTPISNSMTEMYTMQRYLDEKRLKQQGLNTFDAWAKNFGEVVTDWELSASGKYKMKSRFAKFVNMPELMQLYLGFSDVINRDDINESLKAQGKTLPVPKIKGGKPENVIVPRSDFQAAYIGEPNEKDEYAEGTLVWRSENFKREPKEGEVQDNMLRIVGEARKLALDPRIIDPNAPDFEHSKVNTAAKRIFDIYQKWDKQKGTQLVFSDLSTPKGAAAKEQKRILELQEKADLGDAAAMQELEKYSPDELDGILSANDFDVYNELKHKLVALGMPEKEIAFIHDANTDLQKQELFGKVKSGMVRVLIGSTSKMGAGTNVQNRLVALHHLDAPWRPSDLEQREGRIIRQGNELRDADPDGFEVEILRYATEKTMDAMQWQIIENKAKFIGQVRKGDTKSRVVEDIDGEAANAAQMKAASSGNPLILEEMTLRKQIQDLENDKHRHDKQQHRLKATRNKLNQDIGKAEMRLIELDRLLSVPVSKEFDVKIGKAHLKQGQEKARENAGSLILREMDRGLMREIGTFGVFKMYAGRDDFGLNVTLSHGGASIRVSFEPNANVGGVIMRLQNAIDRLPENHKTLTEQIAQHRQSLPNLEKQLQTWDKGEQLATLRERHRQVLNELKPKNKTPNPTQNAENGAGDDVALDVALSAARIYPVDVNVQTLVRETQNALRAVLGDENMKRVRVVSRYEIAKLLPENWGLAEIVKKAKTVRGLHQAKTGNVFVVAENFKSVDLAAITAWHELGHEKVVLSGRKAWRDVMMKAYDNNAVVRAVADKRIKMSKQYQDKGVAVEEALVEMYAAMKSGRYDEFKNRYKVDFPVVPTRSFLQKVMAALRGVINRVLGKPVQFSDNQVIELLGKLDSVDLNLRDKKGFLGKLNFDDVMFDVADHDTPKQRNLAMSNLINAVSFSGSLKDLKQQAGGKWVDLLKIGLQGLGRRQIVDIYGKILPQLKTYDNLVDKFSADGNKTAMRADELVIKWGKLKDKEQLADLMHEATIAQIDADPLKQDGVTGETDLTKADELKAKFEQLSPEAQAVYRQARDDYKRQFDDIQAAMTARLKRMGVKRKDVLDGLEEKFAQGLKGVYFPLSRFGQYVVVVRNEHGKAVSVSRAETMNEARQLYADLQKQFPESDNFSVEKPMLSKEYAQSRDGVGRGFMQALRDELNKNADFDTAQFAYMEDVLSQLYFASLPDLSWAKHGIHRKNRAGFSNDARRAYAQTMSSGAAYLSKLRYGDLLQEQLDKMQEHADGMKNSDNQPIVQRVVDEMVKRHDSMMNPKPNALSTSLTSFGFLWYLGLSPASAIVNLSQTALVAYPIMAAKWGHKKAAAELLKASQQTFTKRKLPSVKMNGWRPELDDTDWNDISGSLNADELVAYNRAVDDGTIDISQAHDLAGIASGEDSGALWRFRGVMRAASYLFHQAERFNRQVTFVAAYRLAKQTGVDSDTAFAQAKKATYDGHFDYATHNRPRFMQGNVARVVFLFKQYSQNMIYTLSRNAYQAAKGDKEARKVFAGLMVAHAAAAGVLGLPMVTTLLAMASWLGGDDDEPWDAEVALRNQLADIFGDKGSEIISKGLSRATPWDISGRVGLDNLIFPNVQDGLEGKRWAESFAAGMAGPVVGLGINFANGSQKMVQGDYLQGLEGFLPVALRNPLKSYRLATDGMKDTSGIVIKDDFNAAELLGQAAGFSAADARLAQEAKSAIYQADKRLAARRAELLAMFAKAKMQGDNDAMSKAREQIQRFNEKNPSRKITVPQMLQSVRNRQKRIDEAKNGIYLSQNRSDARSAGAFGTDD